MLLNFFQFVYWSLLLLGYWTVLTCSAIFFGHLFTFAITGYLIILLYFPYSSPGIHLSSKEHSFLRLKDDIRNQDLGTKCAHCFRSVTAARPFLCTELGVYACLSLHLPNRNGYIYSGVSTESTSTPQSSFYIQQ